MADRPARVLIADDDLYTRDILSRFLTSKGFDVHTAIDGRKALEAIAEFDPDIILLDIKMPEMDGVAVLRAIGERQLDCGVIMISGQADVDMARDTLTMGAADFIYKPFDLEYLETSLLAKLLAMGRP
jgi:DNA-binding NtrC family response regulator